MEVENDLESECIYNTLAEKGGVNILDLLSVDLEVNDLKLQISDLDIQ